MRATHWRMGLVTGLSGALLMACGSSSGTGSGTTGGSGTQSGGASSAGTSSASALGGSSSGGASALGGSSSGGSSALGGSSGGPSALGGNSNSGGGTTGGTSSGGVSTNGGMSGTAGANESGGSGGAGSKSLPPLTVDGPVLKDPSGKTIILRGSSLIDIGSLYANGGQSIAGITERIDKVAAAGVQGHVVRLPVYPEIVYNSGTPTCSPVPYPVGTGPTARCTPKTPLAADDYVSKVLTPAVDYATSKGLYVIIDFHQIDNATSGMSAADAKTFWADIAPRFASYSNVLYEAFNEPIDNSASWATLKPVVQGLVDTIRAGAPNNVIIVPSNTWCQRPGDAASDPPQGNNFMYTAHIYPVNWKEAFQSQVATAVTKAPVFVSEWGYNATDPQSFGTDLKTVLDGNGASWTAWVTDNSWAPPMFSDKGITQLTGFGSLVKDWLSATANDHWIE